MNEYGLKKKNTRTGEADTPSSSYDSCRGSETGQRRRCGGHVRLRGGINEATELICALAERYRQTQTPRDLTFYHSTGLGDRGTRECPLWHRKGW